MKKKIIILTALFILIQTKNVEAQCTTPPTRSNPTVILSTSTSSSGTLEYLAPGSSVSFNMNSYSYFVIENVTAGRTIRISTCGASYDTQITLRDWSTDTFLAYVDDNGPLCSGAQASIEYSGNSSYPHVKVIINQFNCNSTSNFTPITVTYVSGCTTPGIPVSLSASPTGTSTANISWSGGSPAGSPTVTYFWDVYTSGGSYVTGSSTTSTSASVSGLSANSSYYFRVRAYTSCNATYSSWSSNSSTFTTYPSNPTSVSASSSSVCSGTQVTLTASGAQGTVYWYTSGCGSGYLTTGNSINVTPSSTTTYYARNYNGNYSSGCASSTITVNAVPSAPTAATASPAAICAGSSSNLSATSTGNTIYWYTQASGGTSIGNSASGANFSVSPSSNTTYYAEAVPASGLTITSLSASNSYVIDHNSYSGDDRGGIAVTQNYYYYVGDGYTVRYNMPGLTSPVSLTRRDGIFSDLSGSGTLYTLWNSTSGTEPVGTSTSFTVNAIRTLNDDCGLGSTTIALSQSFTMGSSNNSGIFSSSGFVILYTGTGGSPANTFYKVDLPSGLVTQVGTGTLNAVIAENWARWGIGEYNGSQYSIVYVSNSTTISRMNVSTGVVTTVQTFSNLSDMACITYAPWYNKWYFHHEYGGQFGGSDETAGYADATASIGTGCISASRTSVVLTVYPIPSAPTPATASPAAICAGSSSNLSATSTGNTIYWYTQASGGTSIGNSASGANFSVSPSSTTTYYAEAQSGSTTTGSLSTTFASGNGGAGNMFDVTILQSITINSFDVHPYAGTANYEVYYKAGTYVGFETNSGAWTLLATANNITANSQGSSTPLNLNLNLQLTGGQTYSFYITCSSGNALNYTDGTSAGSIYSSNSEIQFKEGVGKAYPFGSTFNPRIWNGIIHYSVGSGGGCLSSTRTLVSVTLNPAPALVSVISDGSLCGSTQLTASGGSGGTIFWQNTTSNGTSTSTSSTSEYVTASGTYYFRAQSAEGCWGPQGSTAVSISSPNPANYAGISSGDYVWSGKNNSEWTTASNWLQYNGSVFSTTANSPVSGSNVYIQAYGPCPSYYPIQEDHITVNKLTINTDASLIVEPQQTLTVNGNLLNNGTLTLKSDATGTATILTYGSVTGSGAFNVQQYITGLRNWYITSPLPNAQSSTFDALSPGNIMYYYDETSNTWIEISDNTTLLNPIKGYIANTNANQPYTFSGNGLNTGNMSVNSLSYTTSNPKKGYHLIGNPYPSYLNPTLALKDNITGFDATVWYRTHDGFGHKFETFNYQSGEGTGGLTENIPPMQSVWMRVTGPVNSLQFTNDMRNHKQAGDQNLKINSLNNLLRVFLTDGTNSDEQVILFNPDAGIGYNAWDSEKQISSSIPQLWSMESGKQIVINSMQAPYVGLTIPLYMDIQSDGNHSVIFNTTRFNPATECWMYDILLDSIHDVWSGQYDFYNTTASNYNRFVLYFNSNPLPVELIDLSAICSENNVLLSWSTVSETNNNYFVVEKSSNGIDYFQMAMIDGAGNSNEHLEYTWMDREKLNTQAYYRLKQIDNDGTESIYGPVAVDCHSISTNDQQLIVYPNPFNEYIQLYFKEEIEGNVSLEIFDNNGKLIFSTIHSGNEKAETSTYIRLTDLPVGTYNLRATTTNFTINTRIVKQR